MHKTKFRDAQLIRTPGWPVVFAMCAALAIVTYVALKMAQTCARHDLELSP